MVLNLQNPDRCYNCNAGNPISTALGTRFDCHSVWNDVDNSLDISVPCVMLKERNLALADVRGVASKFARRESRGLGDPQSQAQEANTHVQRIVNKVIGPPSIFRSETA